MVPKLKSTFCTVLINIIVLQLVLPDSSFVNRPVVKVQQGRLQGIRKKNVDGSSYYYAFHGVPYAKPPVGKLRFKDPVPADEWSGVRDANKSGEVCAQKDTYTHRVLGSDDCLYLNIYTTDLNPDEPRVVMVWIHGGGFAYGHGNDYKLGPDYLVKKDVVLVTFNYRLNIFGFLNLDDEDAPGNQGLKDQVMALKWIQQNIGQFGGDPNLVTIFGESAGSSSVHHLTLSPLAEGLFQKAIMQSGVATNPWAYTSLPMKEEAEKVASKLGKNTTNTKELIEFLQTIEARDLIDAVQSFVNQTNKYVNENRFAPSVDSKCSNPFLTVPVLEAAESGIKVPHIIGYNSDEAIILLAGLKDEDYSEINAHQDTLLPSNEKQFLQKRNVSVDDVKQFFMGDREISLENAQLFVDLVSASSFVINIHDTVATQAKISGIPTYFYKFDHYSKETAVVQQLLGTDLEGASLTEDLYYFWYQKVLDDRGIKQPTSFPIEYIIQQRFFELWTTFAKTGNPNSEISDLIPVEWQPVDNATILNCLKISQDLSLIGDLNILYEIEKFVQDKN